MRTLLLILVCVCLLIGCSSKFRLEKDRLWQVPYGSSDASQGSMFSDKFPILWEAEFSGKVIAPLAVGADFVAVPTSKDKIRIFNRRDGKYAGHGRVKGSAQSGFLIRDTIAVTVSTPPRNRLVCKNMHNRDELWNARVKDIAGGSITYDNKLIVSSGSGGVTCYDIANGSVIWTFDTEGLCKAAPIVAGETVIQPTDKGRIIGIAMKDGSKLFELSISSSIESPVVLGCKAYVVDIAGTVTAFDPSNGSVAWTSSLHEPTWSSPAVDSTHVVITTRSGKVIALDAATGGRLWEYLAVDVIKASPAICGRSVVAGTLTGKLFSLDISDGSKIAERQLDGPIAVAPQYGGGKDAALFVATNAGSLFCFGITWIAEGN